MSVPQDFWGLLDALEEQLPPARAKLEPLLNVSFEKSRDRNKRTTFVAKTVRQNRFGVPISTISFHEAEGEGQGDLTMELASSNISSDAVTARFPGGDWVPPPPPGWGAGDAGPGYSVDRPWGRLWFAFGPGADTTVRAVSFALGAHGAPGI